MVWLFLKSNKKKGVSPLKIPETLFSIISWHQHRNHQRSIDQHYHPLLPSTFLQLLFSFPLLYRLQPALQGAEPVVHSASLITVWGEQRQQDASQHQSAHSHRRRFGSDGLVGHDQSEQPERQDRFHHPEHPLDNAHQQTEKDGQHPVADESHQAPLGNGRHALWCEARQLRCHCGQRKSSWGIFSTGEAFSKKKVMPTCYTRSVNIYSLEKVWQTNYLRDRQVCIPALALKSFIANSLAWIPQTINHCSLQMQKGKGGAFGNGYTHTLCCTFTHK